MRVPAISLLVLLPALSGCPASIIAEYEAARDEALAAPPPPGDGWEPDAVLHLAPHLVDDIVTYVLEENGTLEDEISVRLPIGGTATLSPKLTVTSLELASSTRCDSCVAADLVLDGPVHWRLGAKKGKVPVKVTAALDADFSATAGKKGLWKIAVKPVDVRDVRLEIKGTAATALQPLLEGNLADWVRDDLLTRVKPVEVAAVGSEDQPMRAVRLVPAAKGLSVAMLTQSPTPIPIAITPPKLPPTDDWQLDVSQDSLLDLARVAAFTAGPVSHDVVVDPTSLTFGGHGAFSMGVRLWRPVGKGWWRDYDVTGALEINKKGMDLTPSEVVEGPKSKGAVFVDPLAAIGEGLILGAIEDAVAVSIPLSMTESSDGWTTDVTVRSIQGHGPVLTVKGTLDLTKGKKKPAARPDSGSGMTRPR